MAGQMACQPALLPPLLLLQLRAGLVALEGLLPGSLAALAISSSSCLPLTVSQAALVAAWLLPVGPTPFSIF